VVKEVIDYTDTEVAAHFIEELVYMTGGDWQDSVRRIGEEFKSTFLFLSTEYNGLLYSCRTNPLFAYKIDSNVYMSSQRGALKNFGAAKDLEPGYGSLKCTQLHHAKPESWGRGSVTYHQCNNASREPNSGGYAGMFGGYMREQAEKRSGNKHPEWYNRQEVEENELRVVVDRTVSSYMRDARGGQLPLVPDPRGARGAKNASKHGRDWPGHDNYEWPTLAISDGAISMLTMFMESEVCHYIQDILEPNEAWTDPLNNYAKEMEDELAALGEEEDEEDDEQWVARCELAGTWMTKQQRDNLYPECDDDCDHCISCSCPFHVVHATQRAAMRYDYRTGEVLGASGAASDNIWNEQDWEGYNL
jgi:hypothetical protein